MQRLRVFAMEAAQARVAVEPEGRFGERLQRVLDDEPRTRAGCAVDAGSAAMAGSRYSSSSETSTEGGSGALSRTLRPM